MLQINGKTFMNLQEAVQWLLDNNALPFQCSANYVANTEIGLGTVVNPTPAKVRIGSLIFFADSKVSTVTGLTENGFIVSDQYNDLVDDVVYVSNVQINASNHLVVTLSNGDTIDAGLIKEVSSFSINGSQHLIVNYNDGTNQDLGAIFTGDIDIDGTLQANLLLEKMTGYALSIYASPEKWTPIYVGASKTGNKLTLVVFGLYNASVPSNATLLRIYIPVSVYNKLYPYTLGGDNNVLDTKIVPFFDSLTTYKSIPVEIEKGGDTNIAIAMRDNGLVADTPYYFRIEITLLLSDNLAS